MDLGSAILISWAAPRRLPGAALRRWCAAEAITCLRVLRYPGMLIKLIGNHFFNGAKSSFPVITETGRCSLRWGRIPRR